MTATIAAPTASAASAAPAASGATTVEPTIAGGLLGGARAMLPWLAGVVPFGLTVGVTIAESSVDPLAGLATGPLIFGGSAQLAAVELIDTGAAPVVVIFTVLVINARLLVYSGSMAPWWAAASRRFRGLAASLLIDPTYAVGTDGYRTLPTRRAGHAHYLGGGLVLWVAWQTAIGVGILAGEAIPRVTLLSLIVPYYLIAEALASADSRPGRAAAAVGAAVAIAAHGVPLHAGVVIAIGAGVVAAARLDGRRS